MRGETFWRIIQRDSEKFGGVEAIDAEVDISRCSKSREGLVIFGSKKNLARRGHRTVYISENTNFDQHGNNKFRSKPSMTKTLKANQGLRRPGIFFLRHVSSNMHEFVKET